MSIPLLEFITGPAGTGKTYELKCRIQEAKDQALACKNGRARVRPYGVLTASTGIAALNLSGGTGDVVATINSTLKYFDTASLKDNFASRRLHNALKDVFKLGRNLILDELSMVDAVQLDLIHDALDDINEQAEVSNRGGLGLVLAGDFCQLPPVKAEFAFTAKCWPKFTHTKLTKIWRQDNLNYIQMLNAARGGDGKLASEMIMDMKEITINDRLDSHFEGTTIVPVNKLVDSINKVRLDELIAQKKRVFDFKSFRWGRQLSDWKNIPESRVVCIDAYVMILANDPPEFSYANGSCGHVVDAVIDNGTCVVKLKDGGRVVRVRKVTRHAFQRETPEGLEKPEIVSFEEWDAKCGDLNIYPTPAIGYKMYLNQQTDLHRMLMGNYKPYFHATEGKWVMGEILYTPIRLAYSSTVHKSQGLSLDACQIDYSHAFFGEASMSYVALSRCRKPEGLTIVGNRKLIEDRTNVSSEVVPWI